MQHSIDVRTHGKGLYLFTDAVAEWLLRSELSVGLLTVFVQHTSASLLIQENYDPDVTADLADFFDRLAPERDPGYRHTLEGPDDMPAHIRAALTQTHLSIPIRNSRMMLGTWQGLYLFEHRTGPQVRHIVLHAAGESNTSAPPD